MRITSYGLSNYYNFRPGSDWAQRLSDQKKHDDEVDGLFKDNRFKLGNYSTKNGAPLSINTEIRALFSRISTQEIQAQEVSSENISEHLRQIYKENDFILSRTSRIEVDLDDDVSMDEYRDQLKEMTLALADGDKEKLEELKKAYKEAMKKLKDQLGVKYIDERNDLENKMDKDFDEMLGAENIETVEKSYDISKLEAGDLEQLYFDAIAEPFRIKEPEIIIDITVSRSVEPMEATYNSVEKTTERLKVLSREILEEGLATVDELRSAFANGYNEAVPNRLSYRLQSATYKEMMHVFDELEKEFPVKQEADT